MNRHDRIALMAASLRERDEPASDAIDEAIFMDKLVAEKLAEENGVCGNCCKPECPGCDEDIAIYETERIKPPLPVGMNDTPEVRARIDALAEEEPEPKPDANAVLRAAILQVVRDRKAPHMRIDNIINHRQIAVATKTVRDQIDALIADGRLVFTMLGENGHSGFVGLPDPDAEAARAEVEEVRRVLKTAIMDIRADASHTARERVAGVLHKLEGVVGFVREED